MGRVFEQAEQYLDRLDPGVYVEIGTSRPGDDGSTSIIAGWAQRRGTSFTTVDVDPDHCQQVRAQGLPATTVITAQGQDYLRHRYYSEPRISFLYLDNFDWDWHPEKTEAFVLDQQRRYRTFGLEMTNVNSQRAHLSQAILAMGHMTDRSLIVCDDTWFNPWWGHYSGKSGSAIPYLVDQGYQVLYTEEQPIYGTILGRNIQ